MAVRASKTRAPALTRVCQQRREATRTFETAQTSCRMRQNESAYSQTARSSRTHLMGAQSNKSFSASQRTRTVKEDLPRKAQGERTAPNGKADVSPAADDVDGPQTRPDDLRKALEQVSTQPERQVNTYTPCRAQSERTATGVEAGASPASWSAEDYVNMQKKPRTRSAQARDVPERPQGENIPPSTPNASRPERRNSRTHDVQEHTVDGQNVCDVATYVLCRIEHQKVWRGCRRRKAKRSAIAGAMAMEPTSEASRGVHSAMDTRARSKRSRKVGIRAQELQKAKADVEHNCKRETDRDGVGYAGKCSRTKHNERVVETNAYRRDPSPGGRKRDQIELGDVGRNLERHCRETAKAMESMGYEAGWMAQRAAHAAGRNESKRDR